MNYMGRVMEFLEKSLGAEGFCILLLILSIIYIWYGYNKRKLLEDRLNLEKDKKEKAADRFEELGLKADRLIDALAKQAATPISAGSKQILIADDEQMTCNIIAELIARDFPQVTSAFARDGEEALRRLAAGQFSLLILDLIMPRKSGYDVLAEVARTRPRLPVLVVSGYFESRTHVAQKAGVSPDRFELLHKPFEADELLHLIRRLIL